MAPGRRISVGIFMALLGVAGQAVQVTVTPACQKVLAGKTAAFQARVAGSAHGGCIWTVRQGPGTIHPDTGQYTAPATDTLQEARLRATSRAQPQAFAEAQVLVLPQAPFQIVEAVLGPQWCELWSAALPFKDQETGLRLRPGATVVDLSPAPEAATQAHWVVAGFGQQVTAQWTPRPGARGQLLSYREGDQLHRLDVTGQATQTFCARGPVGALIVESLTPAAGQDDTWLSHTQYLPVTVRGLLPFTAEPLLRPFGIARLAPDAGISRCHPILVAEEGGHCLASFSPQGAAGPRWGLASEPGRADGFPREARFRGPTHLAARAPVPWAMGSLYVAGQRTVECAISDSGNHQIRALTGYGLVTTLAGTGHAGYQDADRPLEAQFHNPQGLALDSLRGILYVADRGNHVVRAIAGSGAVTTLAGLAGTPGTQDGTGPQARFTDLGALAYCEQLGLIVVDGHSIRLVEPDTGEVTTLLGEVATPGFQDDGQGYSHCRRPCLRAPQGLALSPDLDHRPVLLIADTGNHAVRELNLMSGTLASAVGAPGEARLRWGLLRDGLPGALDDGYASVEAPRGVFCAGAAILVAMDAGLARAEDRAPYFWDYPFPPKVQLDATALPVAKPLGVAFMAHTVERRVAVSRPIAYTVEFLNPDGSLADRSSGQGLGEMLIRVEGSFSQRGTATVRVRFVTDQGWSSHATRTVEVS